MAKEIGQRVKGLENEQGLLWGEVRALRDRITRGWGATLKVILRPPGNVSIADGRVVAPENSGQANLGTPSLPFGVVYANSFVSPGGEVVATEIVDQDGGANIKAARSATADMLLALDGSAKFPASTVDVSANFTWTGSHTFVGNVLSQNEGAAGYLSYRYSDDASGAYWSSRKARGSIASPAVINDNDTLWDMVVHGHDGTGWIPAAGIRVLVDGTPGTNDMPGEILLRTTPDGSSTPQTRVKIRNTGVVEFYNHITFNAAISHIRMDTSDGSDTKRIALCGGGDFADTRGGFLWLGGNEYAGGAGEVSIIAGDVAGGDIKLWTGSAQRLKITRAGIITVTIADDTAQAFSLADVGGIEYLRVITTNSQPVVVHNEGGVDVDHCWKASGQINAMFMQGSTGYVALGHDDPDMLFHIRSSIANEVHILLEECAATANAPDIYFRKGRGTCASPVDVDAGDSLSGLYFTGYRNSGWRDGAVITSVVEALGTSSVRAAIVLSTRNDSDVLAERMRVNRNGKVTIIEDSATVRLSGTKELAITITSPEVGTYGQIRIPWDCTVIRVDGNIIGGTSCTVNPEERGTLGSSGTDILSSDMVADANGESVTSSFNNSSLAKGNHLTFDVSAVSGAVSEVNIAVTVTLT